jgi:hypothetical protein
MAKTNARDANSRGRSGAGKFLSNFEPKTEVSIKASKSLKTYVRTSRCCWRPIWIRMLPFLE